jgi:AAA family ATP:ADP antiporter
VGYQFLNTVEVAYQELEARTAFLSVFFGAMGLISIAVNLGITPLVHRHLGVIAGLLVQPLMLVLCSYGFVLQPGLLLGAALKISDRGLSYSINRASKELLYVPIDPVLIYQAKAWIDMFGYRLFKGLGSLLILVLTQWLPLQLGLSQLSWLTLAICGVWIAALIYLQCDYQLVTGEGHCWGRERRCMEGCPLE